MKVNMAKQKLRVNRRMQTIKETTSQSLQNIRHASKNYGQKLHMGVRTAMDNVGKQSQLPFQFEGPDYLAVLIG